MIPDTVLLIGRTNDPHIKGIQNELKKLNEKFFLLDSISITDKFEVRYDKKFNSKITIGKNRIPGQKIKSVWNSTSIHVNVGKNVIKKAHNFLRSEWTEGIKSLLYSINAVWVNNPDSITNAENRLKQLQIANNLGLATPKSLVTNDPKLFREFYRECKGELIAKTLHSSQGLPHNKMIFTTKISNKDLKYSSELQYTPCLFQEYVPKKTEYRVTIIGNTVHSAEIHSQKSNKTMHDWRNYDDFRKTPYVKSNLPSSIEKKLLKLMRNMKLEFGAVDLICTPENEFVFLEINPNGRWWWIQELTGMNIAQDIARYLAT